MDTLTARPRVLKQANLSLIRKVLKAKGTATRAEIAYETKISSTTVRSLLSEMMQNGEIESVGYDESSGGRKAERYGFRPNRYYGCLLYTSNKGYSFVLIRPCGYFYLFQRLAHFRLQIQEFQKTVPYLARHISFPYCFTSFLSIFDKLIVISYSGGLGSTSNPTDSKG